VDEGEGWDRRSDRDNEQNRADGVKSADEKISNQAGKHVAGSVAQLIKTELAVMSGELQYIF
jgi:hypothetical protein